MFGPGIWCGVITLAKIVFSILTYFQRASSTTVTYSNGTKFKGNTTYYDSKPSIVKINKALTVLCVANSALLAIICTMVG